MTKFYEWLGALPDGVFAFICGVAAGLSFLVTVGLLEWVLRKKNGEKY